MQAIAKWLVARPHNAVLALIVTLLLPAPQITSGAIIVLLFLAQGMRLAVTQALIAAAIVVVVTLIVGGAPGSVFVLLASTWVPAALLAIMLARTRSLTLVVQVSVIVVVMTMLVFYSVVRDPAEFWQPFLTTMSETVKATGLYLDERVLTADVAAVSVVLGLWLLYVGGFLLGYVAYQKLRGVIDDFGRLRDLNLGRVIALTVALMSLLAWVIDVPWVQNIAFVVFVMFTLQGVAIGHWFVGKKKLPSGALVAVYVMMVLPLLQELVIVILAVVGYTDAWFDYRRRFEKA